jgi:hypothetical protein
VVGVVGREHELSLAEGFLDSAREQTEKFTVRVKRRR